MTGYSAGQLLRYHAYCKANPDGRVLPPGGCGWDDMKAPAWLRWFNECLTAKTTRGTEGVGKGNRAKRRAAKMADAKAECKWCGQKTGSVAKRFCDRSCAVSYAA